MSTSRSSKKVNLSSPFNSDVQCIPVKRALPSPPSSPGPNVSGTQAFSRFRRAGSPNAESVVSSSVRSDWKTPVHVKDYKRLNGDGLKVRGSKSLSALKQAFYNNMLPSDEVNLTKADIAIDFIPLRPERLPTPPPAQNTDRLNEETSSEGDCNLNWTSDKDRSWRRQLGPYKKHFCHQRDQDAETKDFSRGLSRRKVKNEEYQLENDTNFKLGTEIKTVYEGRDNSVMLEKGDALKDEKADQNARAAEPSVSEMMEHKQNKPTSIVSYSDQQNRGAVRADKSQKQDEDIPGDISALNFSKLSIEDRTPKASSHRERRVARVTRAAQRKIELEKEKDQYRITPLSKEWDTKVRHAVRHGHGQLSSTDFARVVPEYSVYRNQDNWLNDEVINSYLTMIVQHGKKEDRKEQVASHHAFNSFLYKNLSEKGYQSVRRWANRAKIGGKSFLETEKVFVPINQVYNSMGTSRGLEVATKLLQYAKEEVGSTFNESEWSLQPEGATPQQQNSDDCGVFTITNARQIMLGKAPMESYATSDIPVQRQRIVAELINGELLKSSI